MDASLSTMNLRVRKLRDEVGELERALAALEPARKPPVRRFRRSGVLLALALAIAVPGVALANHVFSDVPTNSTFHANIANIARAGITVGCTQTTYCPADYVRRDSMAAFLNRGLGRANQGVAFGIALDANNETEIASTTLAAPGAGYALISVSAFAHTIDAFGCPCQINLSLGGTHTESFYFANMLSNPTSGISHTYIGNQWLDSIPAKGTYEYTALLAAATGEADVTGDAVITVVWIPFGGTGSANYGEVTSTPTSGAANR